MTATVKANSVCRTSRSALPDADLELLAGYRELVLAVSGGSDSLAMLHHIAQWRQTVPDDISLLCVTVDHGLRADAAKEAEFVADQCRSLRIAHRTLHWKGAKPCQGLAERAREMRYSLLCDEAESMGGGNSRSAIVTAHTCDDQLETLSMRLDRLTPERRSGFGLAGMSARTLHGVCHILRPYLAVSRQAARDFLRSNGIDDWVEDPSNTDPRSERVRHRMTGTDDPERLLRLSAVTQRLRRQVCVEAAHLVRREVSLVLPGVFRLAPAFFKDRSETILAMALAQIAAIAGGDDRPLAYSAMRGLVTELAGANVGGQFSACSIGNAVFRRAGDGAVWVHRALRNITAHEREKAAGEALEQMGTLAQHIPSSALAASHLYEAGVRTPRFVPESDWPLLQELQVLRCR